ncbi:MAG: hypothetical protein OXU64_05360 [Gemmatimonadota bacterium]|nr:hypothetical protein [Gemmatimonadota bacterium]
MSRHRAVSAAVSIAVGPAFVSCSGTEPPADSPLAGEWVSESSPWVQSLTLDLLEEDGGEISGSFTTTLGAWTLEGMVKGEYTHPEVRLTLTSGTLAYGGYTGKRVDHNTIDGDFEIGSFGDQVIATRLKRQP